MVSSSAFLGNFSNNSTITSQVPILTLQPFIFDFSQHSVSSTNMGSASSKARRNSKKASAISINRHNKHTKMVLTSPRERGNSKMVAVPAEELNKVTETSTDTKECYICVETHPKADMWNSTCHDKHSICPKCVRSCYIFAIKRMDPSSTFCCDKRMWDKTIENILGKDLVDEWLDCSKAFNNPDQLYCSTSDCWRPFHLWADQPSITTDFTCRKCGLATCTLCREPAHPDKKCGADGSIDDSRALRIAKHLKWRRCYRCRRFVEHTGGCSITTCICGASFCYECGQSIYNCKCPVQFEGY